MPFDDPEEKQDETQTPPRRFGYSALLATITGIRIARPSNMGKEFDDQQRFVASPSKGRWFRVRRILLLVLAFMLASYVGLWVFIESKVFKLRHMLMDLETLKPGVSSFDDAVRIGRKYGVGRPTAEAPCTRAKCSLALRITW